MKKLATLCCLSAVLVLSLVASAAALAGPAGSVSGTFVDFTTGAPIAGGRVVVTDASGRVVADVASDAQGRFGVAAALAPGAAYTARYAARGYQADASRIERLPSAGLRLDPQLVPAGLKTAVHFYVKRAGAAALAAGLTPPRTIRVYRTVTGVVQVVDFKDYCKHVLPHEWIASWGAESLKAGAVAVKEYAWYQVARGGKWPSLGADVKDSTSDQVYDPSWKDARTDAAVDATWSYHLQRDGALFEPQYCSGKVAPCQGLDATKHCVTHPTRMTQWGTHDLADAGWDWQRTLRYYYPGAAISPRAAYVKYTNPVAYELKSLLWTHFCTSVDTPGMRAKLYVRTAKGDKVIFNGTIPAANTTFWFPAWNGMGVDGKRLPSAAYDWVLEVWKGDEAPSVTTGKITVSKIVFGLAGTSKAGVPVTKQAYMVPGNANVYVSATSSTTWDALSLRLTGPGPYRFAGGPYGFGSAKTLTKTVYLNGANAVRARGLETFGVTGRTGVTYKMTVIQ